MEPLLQSFCLFFVQNFSFEFQGKLSSETNTYESWFYAMVLPRFVCLALLAQSSLYYKIMKISPSMTENIAVDGCLSVGCVLLIYLWDAFKQRPLAP